MSLPSVAMRAWKAPAIAASLRTVSASRFHSTLVDVSSQKFDPPVTSHEDAKEAVRSKIFMDAVQATAPRQNWTREEISAIFYQPLLELAYQAVRVPHFLQLKLLS